MSHDTPNPLLLPAYHAVAADLAASPRTWLVTGAAGFIGSNLLEALLRHAQTVRGLDAFVTGFLRLLEGVCRLGRGCVVYEATSATYGGEPAEVKREDTIGAPLSPHALSKTMNELHAERYARAYGAEAVGLRCFNVFGARQYPVGADAAVIPAWIERVLEGDGCVTHGDGEITREFCHVGDVQAKWLAAMVADGARFGRVYNVGTGVNTTLNELFREIRAYVASLHDPAVTAVEPRYGPCGSGDVRHSKAGIARARAAFRFEPVVGLKEGLARTVTWFLLRRGTPSP